MTDRKSWTAAQWFLGFFGVMTTVFFYTNSMDPFNIPKSILIITGGISISLASISLVKKIERVRLIFGLVGILFGITFILLGIIGTNDTQRLLFGAYSRATGLLSYLGLTLLFIMAIFFTRGQKYEWVYASLVAIAGIETLYGMIQYFNADFIKWQNGYNRIIGTLGNPNFMSATLGFSGVALLALSLNNQITTWKRISYGLLSLGELFLALASDSVQGPLIWAIGATVVLALWLRHKSKYKWLFISFSGLAATTLAFLFAGVAKLGPFADLLYQYTLNIRSQYWRAAIKMMSQEPVHGIGVDSFGEGFRRVRDFETFKIIDQMFTQMQRIVFHFNSEQRLAYQF